MNKGQGDTGVLPEGMLTLGGVRIGDTLERMDELEYRLVSRLSFEEACAIVARRAPYVFASVVRVWPTGFAVVVGIDPFLRTVTVISRSGVDYYALRTRRLPYVQSRTAESADTEKV